MYVHTYIHTYTHTYIHTGIHTGGWETWHFPPPPQTSVSPPPKTYWVNLIKGLQKANN